MSKAKWVLLFILAVVVAAPSYAVELTLGGFPSFFRIRPQVYHRADFTGTLSNAQAQALGLSDHTDNIVFVDSRLRLTPQLVLSDSVTIRAQVDVMDNTIWGGTQSGLLEGTNSSQNVVNSGLTPRNRFRGALLVGTPNAGVAVDSPQFFNVRMLHADIVLPNNLGFIRAGRQPFDWGLGILANGGWDPLSDLGFVLDRFLYLKSFPVYKGSFTFVFVSDRLSQGNTLVTASGDGWDGGAVALVYNQGPLTIGGYVFPYIHQTNFASPLGAGSLGGVGGVGQAVSNLNLQRFTLYSGLVDYKSDFFRVVGEMQGGQGNIQVPGGAKLKISGTNIIFAGRVEVYPGFPVKLGAAEFGWAKGDNKNTPTKFEGTVINFSPAYNIDNLLFKHIIPTIYQNEVSVENAYYARAWLTTKVVDHVTFTPQVLFAWNQERTAPLFVGQNVRRFLGTELEGTVGVEVVPGVNFDFLGSIVIAGGGLKDLMTQQANAVCNASAACAPLNNGGFRDPKAPFSFQGRLLVYIDQFFKK